MKSNRNWTRTSIVGVLMCAALSINATTQNSCEAPPKQASTSGVTAATVKVTTGADGLTIEQRNVKDRLTQDNKPGAIEHLYIISAYSGQTLLYSTVRGKVTSSSKRLNPPTVYSQWCYDRNDNTACTDGFGVPIGDRTYLTKDVLSDDGTYGSSVEYIYWWDSTGIYHQQYIQGGMIVHISSEPIAIKSVVLNLETRTAN